MYSKAAVFIKHVFQNHLLSLIKLICQKSMPSALVPCQPGEPFVNYPTRPVDTTTDFEGTTNMQQSQPVKSYRNISL